MESQIFQSLLEGGYGTFGGVLLFLVYFLRQMSAKIDKLIDMNNKVFSLTLSLVDAETRIKSIKNDNIVKEGS